MFVQLTVTSSPADKPYFFMVPFQVQILIMTHHFDGRLGSDHSEIFKIGGQISILLLIQYISCS